MSELFFFLSLGCSKNLVDSEEIIGELHAEGYKLTSRVEDASFAIINTCAFLGEARAEAIDSINSVTQHKNKKNSSLKKIIVVGCLARYYSKNAFHKIVPEVDLLVPPDQYRSIPFFLKGKSISNKQMQNTNNMPKKRFLTASPHSVYLKIAEGCNNRCSYCLIPSLRGKLHSRKMDEIISEAKVLQKLGAREINLVAQDTTAYGLDLYGREMLHVLLKKISRVEGIDWIRLLYTNPARITSSLLNVISQESRICKYIDLPLQHINSDILKSMGRKITSEKVYNLYDDIRDKIPGVVLRTTVMVGFPGEGEKEFDELQGFLKVKPFESVGGFTFSPEKRTAAFSLQPRVAKSVARKRLQILMEQQKKISRSFNRLLLGKECRVLVDSVHKGRKTISGRLYSQAPDVDGKVTVSGISKAASGDFIQAKISGIGAYELMGELSSYEFSK